MNEYLQINDCVFIFASEFRQNDGRALFDFDASSARPRRVTSARPQRLTSALPLTVSALDKHQNQSASALICLNSRA